LAHRLDPGLLTLQAGLGIATWTVPAELALPTLKVKPAFPETCQIEAQFTCVAGPQRRCFGYQLSCRRPELEGATIWFSGLKGTDYTALVQWNLQAGWFGRADGGQPQVTLPTNSGSSGSSVAVDFIYPGLVHIGSGLDHLLFVLGLMVIANRTGLLIGAITAFTLGHSVTLALAALEVLYAPPDLVEVLIALSIVTLAVELAYSRDTIIRRRPWLVSLLFGLFHGLGFATGLQTVGLPTKNIWQALLGFNIGVELGQVVFVLVVLGVCKLTKVHLRDYARVVAYGIGSLGCAGTMQRLWVIWGIA